MSTHVVFKNRQGEELVGDLVPAATGAARATCLFAHCFTCTRNIKAARNIAAALAAEGYAVLRFDFTGLGQSEGDFSDTNFSHNVADLVAAADFLRARGEAPALLVGHSLGGTAALMAASEIPEARAVATIGSPADPAHVRHLVAEAEEEIAAEGSATVRLAGRPFTIKQQFIDDLLAQDLEPVVRGLRRSLLVMHSPVDEIVEVENAARLFTMALHPRSFVSLDDADHLLSRDADSLYAGSVLAAWAARYLPPGAKDKADASGEGAVIATGGAAGFYTEIDAAGHRLVADEPKSYGGSNRGPSPYGLLSAALAACTSMTLGMYARHKKLPFEGARVSVTHDKIHARDCEHCETREGKIDRFTRRISLQGKLSEKERARLLEIADRCPVHRTLESEIEIVSELSEEAEPAPAET